MARLSWSPDARRDLREVYGWIARDSPRYAAATVSRIRAMLQRLRRFPKSGRTIPELASGLYREMLVGQYRAIYRFDRDNDVIVIVSIVHGRRNLPELTDRS